MTPSDASPITSSEDEHATTTDEAEAQHPDSIPSIPVTSLPHEVDALPTVTVTESKFQAEVTLSLQRTFAEGHLVENAIMELKTLRMASNVPLRHVREAVVTAIVENVQIVGEGVAAQRQETVRVMGRWGKLIDLIGGVNAIETISVLQVIAVW
jgi:translation initiation factor eIF-2B subunit epsilon